MIERGDTIENVNGMAVEKKNRMITEGFVNEELDAVFMEISSELGKEFPLTENQLDLRLALMEGARDLSLFGFFAAHGHIALKRYRSGVSDDYSDISEKTKFSHPLRERQLELFAAKLNLAIVDIVMQMRYTFEALVADSLHSEQSARRLPEGMGPWNIEEKTNEVVAEEAAKPARAADTIEPDRADTIEPVRPEECSPDNVESALQ